MKYSMMAKVLPLVLDKTVYGYLNSDGANITKETKKEIKREYKAMVLRTPGLDKGNSLEKNLYIGCIYSLIMALLFAGIDYIILKFFIWR